MNKIWLLIKKYEKVWSYLFFGGLTTLINLVVFNVLYTWQHLLGYQLANVLAWFLSVLFAYITNKRYVFDSHQNSQQAMRTELFSFFFFRVLSLVLDLLIMQIGVGILQQNAFWVKLVDNVLVVIANYFFSKIFIFKEH
ncbi:GtrA family protein [Bombilactobacillus folatiphilus]|uniref:GtrA family protein n=1 Tax=Bombilactobacillus folatiphilus TaxID=2923362 RepID=A0ABY4P944_9LACO|nr:GtrA family protein [Bombilactobacillus folatiphilus]UQS82109.1 GtrA family protein [Bombilactobacillus folatiphilus]